MEEYFILISIIVVIAINLVVYFTIKSRKKERDLREYFKKGLKQHQKE
jgi:uncharacterized protein (UPF0333 family)